jgi:hypothetical protein
VKTHLFLAAALAALCACAGPTQYLTTGLGPDRDPLATKSRSVSVGNTAAIDLRMRDGSAQVIAGTGDSIRVRLILTRHSDRDYRNDCTPDLAGAATISIRQVSRTIDLQVDSKQRLRCSEHWTIEVPEALDVVVSADVANVGVSGISGDVVATADVGNVTIREAGASALARVKSVGDATAESETTTYAEAMAKASVGRTELLVDGHRVNVRRSPGPGGRISLTGSGRDRIIAETGVGDAKVLLTRKQESPASR